MNSEDDRKQLRPCNDRIFSENECHHLKCSTTKTILSIDGYFALKQFEPTYSLTKINKTIVREENNFGSCVFRSHRENRCAIASTDALSMETSNKNQFEASHSSESKGHSPDFFLINEQIARKRQTTVRALSSRYSRAMNQLFSIETTTKNVFDSVVSSKE